VQEPSTHASHGKIVPRLKDLIDEASTIWGIPVTLQMVAAATGLNIKIVRAYYHQETASYTLKTVGKLKWFFQCDIDSVLAWRPPAEHSLPPVRVGSIQLPRAITTASLMIRNMIPAKLAGIPFEEVKEGTGLSRNTVHALQNQSVPPERMRGKTLAAVCDYLSRREGRRITLAELLASEGTAEVEDEHGSKEKPGD
jgi:Cro/C1-type HTH DNA-binding domain